MSAFESLVALTTAEEGKARKALGEIEQCRKLRRTWFISPLLFICAAGASFANVHGRYWLHCMVGSMFVVSGICGWYGYHKLIGRYAGNQRLLQALAEREGDSVYNLEVIPEEHPLLEHWNRRLEKRSLLWRVDRFLSRKIRPGSNPKPPCGGLV